MAGWTIALCVSSCSLLLDWNGYTGGSATAGDADDEKADDVAMVHDAADAIDELDVAERLEAADHLDTPDVPDVAALDSTAPPLCSPKNCGGCCNADGFCAGGGSAATCGTGGQPCRDCASIGQRCEQGACSSIDSGAAPMCTDAQCRSMVTLCIPAYEISCCLPDGTCGCQVQIPRMGQCM
jgi:hypothetical protein